MTTYTRKDIIAKLNQVFDLMDRPRSIRDLQIDGALAIAEDYQNAEHRRIRSIGLIAKRWQGNLKIMLATQTASTLLSPPPSLERVPEVAFDLVENYGKPFLLNRMLKSSTCSPGQLEPQAQMVQALIRKIQLLGSDDKRGARQSILNGYADVRFSLQRFGFDLKFFDAFIQILVRGDRLEFRSIPPQMPAVYFVASPGRLENCLGAHFKVVQAEGSQIFRIASSDAASGRVLLVDQSGISQLDVTVRKFNEMLRVGQISEWCPFSVVTQSIDSILLLMQTGSANQKRPLS